MSLIPAPKSGWKTTEAWLLMLGCGALIWLAHSLVTMLPQLAATPGLPVWAAPLLGLAPMVLGLATAWLVRHYAQLRTDLKLPPDDISAGNPVDAARAAGTKAAAGVTDLATAAEALRGPGPRP